ncbi:homoserine kinase [Carnimonas nigrificans]|uniref:homoserine kinase n=1 Tax=Carnimonas nigrificans TaxID=64323 RepID=UPI000471C290|nr:homoserine kinase [Carnimonas nigrificans]
MAVFTPLTDDQVSTFLERFDVGHLEKLEEVASGTENSTFFVTTDQHRLVLTLFEQGEVEELPFFVDLLTFLDQHQLPIASPLRDRQGKALQLLVERPALLFPRLQGSHPEQPNVAQCAAIGGVLGQMHRCTHEFSGARPNPRDLRWIDANMPKVMAYLSDSDRQLMLDTFDTIEEKLASSSRSSNELPQGALHGDLFRDNAMFEGDTLTGLIDFYNGCTGDLLFDLAIVINDWCSDEKGELNTERYQAILAAYQQERPLSARERQVWPAMLTMTALRYWLSRLLVIYVDPPAHSLTPKPPEQYRDMVRARMNQPVAALAD